MTVSRLALGRLSRVLGSNGVGRRRLRAAGIVVVVSSLLAAGGSAVTADELLTADEAAHSLATADPSAVGADRGQQAPGAPSVRAQAGAFEVRGADVDVTIPGQARNPLTMLTSSGALTIEPHAVSAAASDGKAVSDGAAVVYANTGEDSDTSVVPTETGVETFTNIRGEDASETYSVKVDLPGDEEVRQIDGNTVAIVDPSPSGKPSEDELPEPAAAGTAAAAAARESSGIDTPDANPRAAEEVRSALQLSGTQKPAGVPKAEISEPPPLTQEDLDEHHAGDVPDGISAGEPTKTQAAAAHPARAQHDAEAAAERAAAEQLDETRALSAGSARALNAANDAAAGDQAAVVAIVDAPQSLDADGRKVPTRLTVDGETITMHVEHRGEDVAYPIAADPEYRIIVTRWQVAWYPELVQETYVSHWAMGQAHIGSWHPIYCAWGWVAGCSSAGVASWYNAYADGAHHVAYWPGWDWGPVWRDYYYPVYATRWVVSRWVPYLAPDWSSAITTTVFETGGEELYEDGDWDDGDVGDDLDGNAFTFVAASVRKRPPCKYINRKITVVGMGGGSLKFRYCWNRKKKKVSLDTQSVHRVDASEAPGIGLAFFIDDRVFTPHPLYLDGAWRGALDAHAHFAFKGKVGFAGLEAEITIDNVDRGVVARYNGSWCPYKDWKRSVCGVPDRG